jgi:hypothetical protein
MSEKKSTNEIPEGLKEMGKIFTIDFNVIGDFVKKSSIQKLQKILKEDVEMAGFIFRLPKSNEAYFLLNILEADKTLLMSTKKEKAERFYKALSSLRKKEK